MYREEFASRIERIVAPVGVLVAAALATGAVLLLSLHAGA